MSFAIGFRLSLKQQLLFSLLIFNRLAIAFHQERPAVNTKRCHSGDGREGGAGLLAQGGLRVSRQTPGESNPVPLEVSAP